MYHLLAHMEWAHLPVAGGIYDQHPAFLEQLMIIFTIKDGEDRRKAEREKNQAKFKRR